jgi:uncharacterized cofD-like protein
MIFFDRITGMKQIVTIGGGTGSYTVLSGLKNIPDVTLTALVAMADDGGSTGVLRDELGVLPAGDVRQCLVALSEHTDIVRKLMNYRFTEGGLKGHNFGNIFLAALEKVTGDFTRGIEIASDILKVKGKVIPITENKAELVIMFADKSTVEGESKIDKTNFGEKEVEKVFYKNSVEINLRAENAIEKADYIIIGPGNFYSSIIPNFIVNGFREVICNSHAKIILPINLTNKDGHTNDWKVSNYVNTVEKYLGRIVDFILVNNEKPTPAQIEYYKSKIRGEVIIPDDFKDGRVIRAPLLSHAVFEKMPEDALPVTRGFIRHDSKKLAECINNIINK